MTTAKSTAKAPASNLTVERDGNSLVFTVHDLTKVARQSSNGNDLTVCYQNKMETGHRINLIINAPK